MSAEFHRIDGPDGRTYRVVDSHGNEVYCPSVTTILGIINKPFLIPWATKLMEEYLLTALKPGEVLEEADLKEHLKIGKNRHRAVKEEAGLLGGIAHEYMESYLETGEMGDFSQEDVRVRNCVEGFRAWYDRSGFIVVAQELRIYHPDDLYAGTMDVLVMDPESDGSVFHMLDWKTSNHYSVEYALQTVAYKKAYERLHPGHRVGDIYIVRVGKNDAELQVVHIPESTHDELYEVFLAARKLFCWQKEYTHGSTFGKSRRTGAPKKRSNPIAVPRN